MSESDSSSESIENRNRGRSLFSNAEKFIINRNPNELDENIETFARVLTEKDPKSYKKELYCSLCEISFDEVKRKGCAFCYNAVCEECSPFTCAHPNTKKPERICMNCYYTFMEENSYQRVTKELQLMFDKETQAKLEEAKKRKEAENRCEELEKLLKERTDEFDETLKSKSKLESELIQLKINLDKISDEMNGSKANINFIQKKFSDQETHINKLVGENTKLNDQIKKFQTGEGNNQNSLEVEKLTKENNDLKEKIKYLQTTPKASTCGCIIS
jgi:DNA repair exonuclease SbcCD ATPase subunit